MSRLCPCGTGAAYDDCCGPLHVGSVRAETPEQLMRSRYSAFVVGDEPYLLRTWHEATRPASVAVDDGTVWTGLEVLRADGDVVEFRASFVGGEVHETSRFLRGPEGWTYVRGRHH